MVTSKAMQRLQERCDFFAGLIKSTEENPPLELGNIWLNYYRMVLKKYTRNKQAVERGEPLAAVVFPVAPEIFAAMDIPTFIVAGEPLMGLEDPVIYIDEADRMGMASGICTLLRENVALVAQGYAPLPTVLVSTTHPCDSVNIAYQTIGSLEGWRDIPQFAVDGPYLTDERALDYYTAEIERLISFLEKHTGKKLDLERLRQVIEESNKQIDLWWEYKELRRAVPAPHAPEIQMMPYFVVHFWNPGDPMGTVWMQELVSDAEERVRNKKGFLPNERIRVVWFDFRGTWRFELGFWMEQEWGAIVVDDIWSHCTMPKIDTSSYESMIRGVAERSLDHIPMYRQFRVPAEVYLEDLVRAVKDYKADCVIWPGHMGHKDATALTGLIRDTCREIGVPFLGFWSDLFDARVTTIEAMKAEISQFFTTMGLGAK